MLNYKIKAQSTASS